MRKSNEELETNGIELKTNKFKVTEGGKENLDRK